MPRFDRPDGHDAGGADPTTVSVEPARFPYRCRFVPKRARIERVAYLTGEGFINVRRLGAGEKGHRLAFRVHFPERFTDCHFLREATFDILWFEGRLWWPLTDDIIPAAYPSEAFGARKFLDRLKDGWDLFGLMPFDERLVDFAETQRVLATSREMKEERDEAAARLQRAVIERVLLVGDAVYAIGGEPVYVQRKLYGQKRDATVASLYPNRELELGRGLDMCPGFMGWFDGSLERGSFQLAGEREAARAAALSIGMPEREMPTIEVVMDDLIRLNRDDIRTDALFAFAVDGRRSWHDAYNPSTRLADALKHLKAVAERPTDSATTADRFDALHELAQAVRKAPGYLGDCHDIRYLSRNLKPVMAVGGLFERTVLSSQDEAALSTLVNGFVG